MINIDNYEDLRKSLDNYSKEVNNKPFKFHSLILYDFTTIRSWGYEILECKVSIDSKEWWNYTFWIKKKEEPNETL